jgi:hypothetical protein
MTEPDVNTRLRSLRQNLAQMKALLAWEQLKQSEIRPGQPPAFQMYDPTPEQLRDEYSFFVATALDVHSVLNDHSPRISKAARESVRRQLVRIEKEVDGLDLQQRFWRI